VWLLLEGGETSKDEATARLLETELARLEKTLKLPETDEEGPPLLSDVPLKISFPVMRLSRRDPLEKSFVGLLSRSGGDLAEGKGPVVLPVFGRGRALWPLSGERLSAAEIAEAAEFLTGACSCQVKEMNPGLDLLFDADWEKSLSAPPSAGAASPPPSVQAAAPAAAARLARSWGTLWAGVAFLSIAVLVVGTLLLRPRRPPGPC